MKSNKVEESVRLNQGSKSDIKADIYNVMHVNKNARKMYSD